MGVKAFPAACRGNFLVSLVIASLLVTILLLLLELGWRDAAPPGAARGVSSVSPVTPDTGVPPSRPAVKRPEARVVSASSKTSGVIKCRGEDGSVSYLDAARQSKCRGESTPLGGQGNISIIARPPGRQVSTRHEAPVQRQESPPVRHRSTRSKFEVRRKRCRRYKQRLERVRSLMRAGYKAHEYNRLMERKRAAKAAITDYCR